MRRNAFKFQHDLRDDIFFQNIFILTMRIETRKRYCIMHSLPCALTHLTIFNEGWDFPAVLIFCSTDRNGIFLWKSMMVLSGQWRNSFSSVSVRISIMISSKWESNETKGSHFLNRFFQSLLQKKNKYFFCVSNFMLNKFFSVVLILALN